MKVLVEGHTYELVHHESYGLDGCPVERLQFINKVKQEDGALVTVADGTTNEEVLRVLIDRMNYLQKRVPCRENAIVITKLEESLMWLEKRTADRNARGVEGAEKA